MSTVKSCDKCGFARQKMVGGAPVGDVVRYTLRRETDQTREVGRRVRRHQQSAGGIDLCGPCWSAICAPRMNPAKSHARIPKA